MNKWHREVLKEVERETGVKGNILRQNGHIAIDFDGYLYFCPATPSDHRAKKKIVAAIRRVKGGVLKRNGGARAGSVAERVRVKRIRKGNQTSAIRPYSAVEHVDSLPLSEIYGAHRIGGPLVFRPENWKERISAAWLVLRGGAVVIRSADGEEG